MPIERWAGQKTRVGNTRSRLALTVSNQVFKHFHKELVYFWARSSKHARGLFAGLDLPRLVDVNVILRRTSRYSRPEPNRVVAASRPRARVSWISIIIVAWSIPLFFLIRKINTKYSFLDFFIFIVSFFLSLTTNNNNEHKISWESWRRQQYPAAAAAAAAAASNSRRAMQCNKPKRACGTAYQPYLAGWLTGWLAKACQTWFLASVQLHACLRSKWWASERERTRLPMRDKGREERGREGWWNGSAKRFSMFSAATATG